MAPEIQLAGFYFDADDWRAYDDETRESLLAAGHADGDDFADDEPTLIRAPARAGA
jgi:hypothetical protein